MLAFVWVRQSLTPINEAALSAKWLTVRHLWKPPLGVRRTVRPGTYLMDVP